MAGPAPVTAAGAAPAEAGVPARPNMMGMLLQMGAMYFLWNNWNGKSAARKQGADSLVEFSPTPTPTPSEYSAVASDGAQPPSLFSALGLPDPTKSHRHVPAELLYREDARKARLSALPKDGRLLNMWGKGQVFDIFVYLSTSAEPIVDFSALDSVYAEWKTGAEYASVPQFTLAQGGRVEVSEAGVPGSNAAPTFSLLGGYFKKAVDKLAARGNVTRLPNATFNGLADSEDSNSDAAIASAAGAPRSALFWAHGGLTYDWEPGTIQQSVNVTLPRSVLTNATGLYAHVFAVVKGSHPDASDRRFAGEWTVATAVYPLLTLLKRKPTKVTYSLLGDGSAPGSKPTFAETATPAPTPPPSNETRWLPYWRPALPITMIVDHSAHAAKALPPPLDSVLDVVPDPRTTAQPGGGVGYLPPFLVDDFWTLSSHLVELNASSHPAFPLEVSYAPGPLWRWAMAAQMGSQFSMQESLGAAGEGESDVIKSILLETNPVLLAVTALVSTLHMVFEFLAFRNDVSFWRGVKTTAGLSVRAIAMSFVTQLIILLYLADNDTSWMVLASSGMGLAIEAWKLQKALVVNVVWLRLPGLPFSVPWVDISDKEEHDVLASETRAYDDIATRHMLTILAPLVLGQAAYSLVHETHKSWYSWLIGSLTSSVYLFGFASMTPQLYINYRLKSVAAMPGRAMTYKFLNTIIDDIFSFVVKMPTLHRLACFRDDVIFLIYLAQRWLYPVDKSRKNEFGASGLDYENAEARKRGLKRVLGRAKLERRPGPYGEEPPAAAGSGVDATAAGE